MGLVARFREMGSLLQYLIASKAHSSPERNSNKKGRNFGGSLIRRKRRDSSSYLIVIGVFITILFVVIPVEVNGLVFKNGMPEYLDGQQGRSLIGAGGVILDIPKIRVLRYKVRNNDPHVVSDELDCENSECGDIVEPPLTKLHLGTNGAKEANEWSIPANVTQLVLECKSRSGVVEWEYEGNGIMSDIEIENTRIVGDFWSPSTYLHISLLTFNKISDQLTGKYTCKNQDKSNKSNSFYLFVPQQKSEVINDGRKIEVMPPSQADEIILPCRMEKRHTPIYLFRKGADGVHRKVPLRGHMRYDPYLGFILPVTPDVFGDYLCKVDKKRKKKTKREAEAPSVAMMPPQSSISITTKKPSPGFSAFPNSMELSEIVQTNEDAEVLAALLGDEHSTLPPDMAYPPVPTTTLQYPANFTGDVQEIASFQPYKHRRSRPYRRRRRKRPFARRRHGINAEAYATSDGISSDVLSRREGSYVTSHVAANQIIIPGPPPPPPPPPRGLYVKQRPRPIYHHQHRHRPALAHLDSQTAMSSVTNSGSSGSLGHHAPPPPSHHRSHYYGHQHHPHQHHYHHHHHHHPHKSHFHRHGLPPGMPHPRLPPGAGAVAGVLPTYSGAGSNTPASQEVIADKLFSGSVEVVPPSSGSAIPSSMSPHEKFIAETLMSRVDGTKMPMPMSHPPPKKPISIFPQNLLPPTMTVVHTMQCVLKKMVLGADVPCNASLTEGIAVAERHGNTNNENKNIASSATDAPPTAKEHKTILEVTVLPSPENKFYPAESAIFTTTPFFVKWETRFTDYANWAEANHTLKNGAFKRHRAEEVADFENGINSLEVYDVPIGETGNITVTYMGGKKEIKTHTWHYLIINSTTFSNKGLKQTVDGVVKVFMCRSATSKRPFITLSRLTENGCPESSKDPFAGAQDYTEEDCGVGCSLIRTKIEQGVVKCTGDGIDETLTFPEEMQCTGRPYFINRGQTKNLTLTAKGNRLLIPCVINNPNADVYLFHENNGIMTEVTDNSTYDLKAGFYFDTSTLTDPYGTYVCTSTPDTEDQTDMVRYQVTPMEDNVFYPPHETVFGIPPFKFMWESMVELEVLDTTIGKFDKGMFAKVDGSRPHVGTFEIFANVSQKEGSEGEVRVIRKSDRKVVHTWRFKHIDKVGLSLDKERNLFRCQAATENQPILYAVPCDNPNVCKLERKYFNDDDEDIKSGRENSHCGNGCVQLKIWRNKPLGFVRCKGDGVDETLQYFLTENSTILTQEEKSALDQFKNPEILNGVKRMRVGETVDFICKANRYFYSKGFQWAIETRSGQKKFIDAKVRDDVIVKDEIRSVINLKILDAEWKSVWCYTPDLKSNQWANISQPIYLRL